MDVHPYTDSQQLHYSIRNPWSQPLGRINDYLRPITLPPSEYVEARGAHLVSLIGVVKPFQIIHETTPFLRLKGWKAVRLAAQAHLGSTESVPATLCPLVDFRGWRGYFHWFLDFLPRVFVAEHHRRTTGDEVRFLVPESLAAWQAESLARLGVSEEVLLAHRPTSGHSNILSHALLAASSHRHQHETGAPFDTISPLSIRQLSERLHHPGDDRLASGLPQRLFVSRRGANSRRITNESEVSTHLETHGFSTVQLEKLDLAEQIAMFRHATHVIAMHGAGLTNLIHARRAAVLELFASQHGIRPDYYQIAAINNLPYFFHALPSVGASNDVRIPLSLLDDFLAMTG